MAMQRSDELIDAASLLFRQLQDLGVKSWSSGFNIWQDDGRSATINMCNPDGTIATPYHLPHTEDIFFKRICEARQKGDELLVMETGGKELEETYNYMFSLPEVKKVLGAMEDTGFQIPTFQVNHCAFFSQGYLMFITYETVPEMWDVFKRFAKVFEQTYTRFLDLQKAEAQTREAQIEASLERVRSRSLAMHNTSELQEVIHTVHKELLKLNIAIHGGSFISINKEIGTTLRCWGSGGTADTSEEVHLPSYEKPFCTNLINRIKNGPGFFTEEYTQQEKKDFFNFLFQYEPWSKLDSRHKEETLSSPGGYTRSCCVSKHTSIFIINHFGEMFSASDNDILKRFGKVFDQTYTRFLDLQKAEAQARQAKIEASLERVRASAMAMHKSDELSDVLTVLFEQFDVLNIRPVDVHLDLFDLEKNTFSYRATGKEGKRVIAEQIVDLDSRPEWQSLVGKWKSGKPNTVAFSFYPKEVIRELMTFFPDIWAAMPEDAIMSPEDFPDGIFDALGYCKFGYIGFHHYRKATEEEENILIRFANEFERLYQRFLDLQKAEAQARESRIQLALERVRARTMAMQHSNELQEVVNNVYERLSELEVEIDGAAICTFIEGSKDYHVWIGGLPEKLRIKFNDLTQVQKDYNDVIERRDELFTKTYSGKTKREYISFLLEETILKSTLPEDQKKVLMASDFFTTVISCTKNTAFQLYRYNGKPFLVEETGILKRFAKVFEQAYIRFLDLQKAEAQAREAKIEASMERIRGRAMAMHSSDELMEVANVLREQMGLLDQPELETSALLIYRDDPESWDSWYAFRPTNDPEGKIKSGIASFTKNSCELTREIAGMYLSSATDYTLHVSGAKRDEWLEVLMKAAPEIAQNAISTETVVFDTTYFHFSDFNGGSLLTVSYLPPSAEIKSLQRRAASVFDLAYRRFLDLKRAEAQAREAQIETALERVRSRSMGMQKSEELKEVIQCVYDQFGHLNIHVEHTGFIMDYKTRDDMHIWLADKHAVPFEITIPYFDCAHWNSFSEAKEKGRNFFANHLSFEEKNKFYQDLFKLIPGVPKETLEYYFSCPGLAISTVLLENVGLYIENFSGTPYSDKDNDTVMRFGKVFQQTYTRFLDLQKAEAQTREAKIEAVLERIRSRTMAMQKSDELTDVAGLLFKQVTDMGIKTWTAGFNVWSEDNNSYVDYITSPNGGFIEPYTVYTDTAEALTDISNARKSGVEFDVQYVEGEKIKQLYLALTRLDEKQYEIMLQDGIRFPSHQYEHFVFGSKVSLMFITYEPVPEAHDIFRRLGKVFEQTYTRFLDLQKVEARAREARIETALERVRSRTMAMQQSDELRETVLVLYQQLQQLNFNSNACNIIIIDKETNNAQYWVSGFSKEIFPESYAVPYLNHPYQDALIKPWKEGDKYVVYEYTGGMKQSFDEIFFTQTEFRNVPEEAKRVMMGLKSVMLSTAFISYGALQCIGPERLSEENSNILQRFANVFEQTYTRFLDLQKAEAQAREAKIETALEKVRSRTMAMQRSAELAEVATVLFQQVKALGVPQWTCGFGIFEIDDKEFTWYPGGADGEILQPCKIPLTEHPVFISFNEARKRGDELFVYEKEGEFQADHYRYMMSLPGMRELLQNMLDAGLSFPTFQIDHIASFSHGNLVFITYEPFPRDA
jgi:hypothetical protein